MPPANSNTISRRGILTAIAAASFARPFSPAFGEPAPTEALPPLVEPGLATLAAKKGLLFGTVMQRRLRTDLRQQALYQHECSLLVTAYGHWDTVSPQPGKFDPSLSDSVVAIAARYRKKLRGHCLVWHGRLPKWFAELPSRDAAVNAMRDHIVQVGQHYAGQMHSWDVVNEALQPAERKPFGLRTTPLVEKIGPDFIDIAFSAAREADPKAILTYNDFYLEFDIPDHRNRRNALLQMIDGMRKRNTPVDAVGIQSHIDLADMPRFNEQIFAEFLSELAKRDLKIIISEFDVNDRVAPADTKERDRQVADATKRYLSVALDNPQVIALITWGLMDDDSWITRGQLPAFIRPDSLRPRPLPFDDDFRPKPMYDAMVTAINAAPVR